MSDPVTNIEIEDVLSSIRRLVSEDGRKSGRSEEARAPENNQPEGRLVLTPALRVSDGEEARPDVPEAKAESDHNKVNENAASDSDVSGSVSQDKPWTTPEATLHGVAESVAAELPEDATEKVEEQPDPLFEKTLADTSDADGDDTQDEDGSPQYTSADTFAPSASLSEKIAAVEAAIADADDQWEPDDAGVDEYAGTEVEALAWDEPSPAKDVDQVQEPFEPTSEASFVDSRNDDWENVAGATSSETVLDEEALRELVAQIVRQELQGVLGERITRNVRKLVRREIQRALTVQDFE